MNALDTRRLEEPQVSSPLHCATLHYTTLHYTTLHYTTLHYTTLHYTTLELQVSIVRVHSSFLQHSTALVLTYIEGSSPPPLLSHLLRLA